MFKIILGYLLVFTGIFDAIKYSVQARKINKAKSAKNISRRFINFAIINDLVRLSYGFVIRDWYITASSILALVCMCQMYWQLYLYYPYRKRGLLNFKKPNIFRYLWNSILPNKIRKRL